MTSEKTIIDRDVVLPHRNVLFTEPDTLYIESGILRGVFDHDSETIEARIFPVTDSVQSITDGKTFFADVSTISSSGINSKNELFTELNEAILWVLSHVRPDLPEGDRLQAVPILPFDDS